MRRYGLVLRLSFLAIALGDIASAFSLSNGYTALFGRFNRARSVVVGESCSKQGVLGLSAVATAVDPAIQDKILKWERKAQRHFSVPRTSSSIDLQQVDLDFVFGRKYHLTTVCTHAAADVSGCPGHTQTLAPALCR